MEDHDDQINAVFEAIHQLIAPSEMVKKQIGFTVKEKRARYGKKTKRKKK